MVADAVHVERVSTPKFPANREKNREFFNFEPVHCREERIHPMISALTPIFPTKWNREFFRLSREFWRRNREFPPAKIEVSPNEVFGTHSAYRRGMA